MPTIKTIKENTSDFKKKHGNKYSYIKYIDNNKKSFDKIIIICPLHGEFNQTIHNHKNGQGCPKCRLLKLSSVHKHTVEQNINDFKKIHGDKYDYTKYTDENKFNVDKITIGCKIHGYFEQTIADHKTSHGCPKCGRIISGLQKRTNIEQNKLNFIKQHGDKYDYSSYNTWTGYDQKIKIKCSVHGEFEQKISKHLKGQGCPMCGNAKTKRHKQENPSGWSLTNWIKAAEKSKHFDSFKVYVIKCWNEKELFYKIGRTYNKTIIRFGDKKQFNYNFKIVKEYIGTAEYVYKLESILKKLNKEYKYVPQNTFKGMYECFSQIK